MLGIFDGKEGMVYQFELIVIGSGDTAWSSFALWTGRDLSVLFGGYLVWIIGLLLSWQ